MHYLAEVLVDSYHCRTAHVRRKFRQVYSGLYMHILLCHNVYMLSRFKKDE